MNPETSVIAAYAVSIALMLGYAAWTAIAVRNARRNERSGGGK